jgi:hypothetical protein
VRRKRVSLWHRAEIIAAREVRQLSGDTRDVPSALPARAEPATDVSSLRLLRWSMRLPHYAGLYPAICTHDNCDYTAEMEPHRIKFSGSSGGRRCKALL